LTNINFHTVHSTTRTATTKTGVGVGAKNQAQMMPSHQIKIDTLLNKKDTNIHVIRPHSTGRTAMGGDNIKPDVLSSDKAVSPDASDNRGPYHEQSCHSIDDHDVSVDVDCLFDDIDYHELFDSEPLSLITENKLDNVVTPCQQHKGSCDPDEMSCDTGSDDTIIEIPDGDDDVSSVSTLSFGKFIIKVTKN